MNELNPRRGNKKMRGIGRVVVLIFYIGILSIILSFFFSEEINRIKAMQTDTLNQIMETRQEMEALTAAIGPQIGSQTDENDEKVILSAPELIARVIAAEARGADLEGQMAVAQVIYDRSWLWEEIPEDVVEAPSQFAEPYGGNIPPTTWEALIRVFYEGERVWKEPVTHFHSASVNPYWTSEKVCRGEKGGNVFWY